MLVDVDEHRRATGPDDARRGRDERLRRHENLVAGTDAGRDEGEEQRVGSRADRDRVAAAAVAGQRPLEARHRAALQRAPAAQRLGDQRAEALAVRGPCARAGEERNLGHMTPTSSPARSRYSASPSARSCAGA